jgi:NADPH:quinone reductase-like Zn-dependent oxidoreductase
VVVAAGHGGLIGHLTRRLWTLERKRARIQGTGPHPVNRETLERLIFLAAQVKLTPVIDGEYPLARAADAHRAIQARETFGKVILRP